jgi:type I restriction enzyme R subunit
MHRAMKAVLPNAVLIGFTGTPLLKTDSATSREIFGGYIHTYKFNEAVSDKVVLDLLYEARDIEQQLGPAEEIDAWFDVKTRGLNTWQRDALRERWGTMQTVLSSRNRMDRVVADVLFDFSVKPRLNDGRGNAILVASSIYEACKYYELFSRTPLRDHCAIVTSFAPQNQNMTTEDTGANSPTDKQFILDTYNGLLRNVTPVQRKSKAETYEDAAKLQFKDEPARMKLLIVVDKLLTGFDAPGCTYLYIDKEMRNHGLFQAICRTNRLDDATKDFGYIVDYKRLFGSVAQALQVYTAELEEQTPGTADSKVLMQTRLANNRKQLDASMEQISLLTEPVEPPKGELEQIRYFCGNSEIASDLEERAPLRTHLYRQAASLVRAYANIKDELREAGYSSEQVTEVSRFVVKSVQLRDTVRHASQETLELKAYESDMRHLIDTYVEAARPQRISEFGDRSLLEIIAARGVDAGVDSLPEGVRNDPRAVAEVIANNVRRKIVQETVTDPAFYESMSQLLAEIVAALRARSIDYREFLRQAAELAVRVQNGSGLGMPATMNTPGRRVLYSNLGRDEDLALRLDAAVQGSRQDSWRGNVAKEQLVKRALAEHLESDAEVERVFAIAKEHY